MAVTAHVYNKLHYQSSLKEASTHTVKCALFTSSITISQSADDLFTNAPYTGNQVAAANGYSTGGVAVTGLAISNPDTTHTRLDSADPAWTVTGTGFTFRYAVFYDTTTNVVIAYVDFGTDVTWLAGSQSITLDANGIARVAVS